MSAVSSRTIRSWRFSFPVLLVAASLTGCGYSKPIQLRQINKAYNGVKLKVTESFLTQEEKDFVLKQLDRVKKANLHAIETKEGKWGTWSYEIAEDRFFVYAQLRSLKQEILPASNLSEEEKDQGLKTCEQALCALGENKLPLRFKNNTRNAPYLTLHYSLQTPLRQYREMDSILEKAKDDPAAAARVVPADDQVRRALKWLERGLTYAKEHEKLAPSEGPCQIDFTKELKKIENHVDDYLKEMQAG